MYFLGSTKIVLAFEIKAVPGGALRGLRTYLTSV
jgi:hypothetical protein